MKLLVLLTFQAYMKTEFAEVDFTCNILMMVIADAVMSTRAQVKVDLSISTECQATNWKMMPPGLQLPLNNTVLQTLTEEISLLMVFRTSKLVPTISED